MLGVFLRDGDDIYRTYSTTARGVDRLVFPTTSSTSRHTVGRKTGRTRRRAGRSTQLRIAALPRDPEAGHDHPRSGGQRPVPGQLERARRGSG